MCGARLQLPSSLERSKERAGLQLYMLAMFEDLDGRPRLMQRRYESPNSLEQKLAW